MEIKGSLTAVAVLKINSRKGHILRGCWSGHIAPRVKFSGYVWLGGVLKA